MEKLNERAACFVEKFACELAESFMPQDGMCRQKKKQWQLSKTTTEIHFFIQRKGAEGGFYFEEEEDARNICFSKGSDGLYGINVELNCLSFSTEAHLTPINEFISQRGKEVNPLLSATLTCGLALEDS